MRRFNWQVTDDGAGSNGDRDAALVRRVLDGDAGAFTTLIDRHAAACLRFATRMLGNRADAEDATQETLVRAYRALGRYEDREVFRTWLFSILVNRCRTAAMRRGRRDRRVIADEATLAGAAVDSDAAAVDLHVELERALAALDPDQREAFVLKHVEQWSYEEMAAATGVGVSALKMRVKRACERLQSLMAEVRVERR
jgi:RNA polymerase sigma-70 factor (ECF subfamily)